MQKIKIHIPDILAVLLFLLGIGFQVYLIYFGYKTYNYLVPPGSDVVQHYNIIQKILSGGGVTYASYPTGFHLIVIALSWISRQDIFQILTYWTPALMILPSLAMYFLLRQLFDRKVSVITSLIMLITSGYPVYAFLDGNYPDMFAYGFLTLMMIAFLLRFFRTQKIVNAVAASLFFLAIAITHNFTFVNVAAIMLIFGLIQLYIMIVQKKFKIKFWGWQALIGLFIAAIVYFSLFYAVKLYGPLIMKFADGFIANKPAVTSTYLNQPIDYAEYPLFNGYLVWYLGVVGVLYLIISNFKTGLEARAKQLVLVWVLYFFIMSRFGASGLPARFARELAPALIVAIGFLINYIAANNPLKVQGYKVALGYGLIGFLVVMNSWFYTGPAKLPFAFNQMIWFWPKDQQKLDYITSHVPATSRVIYNPYADLFIPIKATPNFFPLRLTDDQVEIAQTTKVDHYAFKRLSAKEFKSLGGYKKMIYILQTEVYTAPDYIFIDVKPPSDPDEKAYPRYAGYDVYNKVIVDISDEGTLVKEFPDGSKLVRMD